MATRSTNVESEESTMLQNAVVSCNRRLLATAIARTRLNIHLRSEDFVRIVLRGVLDLIAGLYLDKKWWMRLSLSHPPESRRFLVAGSVCWIVSGLDLGEPL